jgi:hypothetical protein
MAHKHNRRRVRPRNRNPSPLNPTFDLSDDLSTSSESSIDCSTYSSSTSASSRQTSIPSILRNPNPSIASRHWHNRYTAWQNRDKAQKREAANIEAEQFKLFGGLPGDDIGLCYKMLEVFEGMDWIE